MLSKAHKSLSSLATRIGRQLGHISTTCSPPHHLEVHENHPSGNEKVITVVKYKDMAGLNELHFDNVALRTLPIDTQEGNFTRQVPGACFSLVEPTPVDSPELVASSLSALGLLDLKETEIQHKDFVQYFSGNKKLIGSQTAAHCYCGHQFGSFAGQLGDGAAVYLGEVVNNRNERWELQLKGSGKTPYSRTADGRKVLRSSVREFLCSEAMHGLGIPTTRAGTCITSKSQVIRDIFYDGNAKPEKCTIISRIAPTFIRFGSFEICKPADAAAGRQGPSVGRTDILQLLLDYVVQTFYPAIWEQHTDDRKRAYLACYEQIVTRTAELAAKWMCVGWCHGVLNTDNMSIVGITIDYGPYGFMDTYDPQYICNTSDDGGRYAYDQQPAMCRWNLGKLAEAWAPLLDEQQMQDLLETTYDKTYQQCYYGIMRKKLGVLDKSRCNDEAFKKLLDSFLETMHKTGADFTNSFRALNKIPLPSDPEFTSKSCDFVEHLLTQCATVEDLKNANQPKMDGRQLNMLMMLMQVQPDLLAQLRGGQKALLLEMERREKLKQLETLTAERKREDDGEAWNSWLQLYTDALKQEESGQQDLQAVAKNRIQVMNDTNPRFILRNYIAQNAIDAAEKGDYSEVQRVLRLLEHPFDEGTNLDLASEGTQDVTAECSASHVSRTKAYDSKPPKWAAELRVT